MLLHIRNVVVVVVVRRLKPKSVLISNLRTMAVVDSLLLKSKFRGCLLGGLLGDCLGAPFEGDPLSLGANKVIQNYFDKLEEPDVKGPYKPYTDDTAMTKSVIKCLCDKPEVDFKCMARLFVHEFYKEPRRGYGANVVEVFEKLRTTKFADIYKPAKEQFGGSGSYGNGAAMRTAPVALYLHKNEKAMLHAAEKCAEITHTNRLGVTGAVLQCLAIRQALSVHPADKIDPERFCGELIDKIKDYEGNEQDDLLELQETGPYTKQMLVAQDFLAVDEDDLSDEEIVKHLGNSIAALHSVPTAIYCFLRAQHKIPGIETDNIFRRTIQYAISLGGDTDTIASMAGAIAGAYLGEEYINENMQRHCEFYKEMLEMADNLYSNAVARYDGENTS